MNAQASGTFWVGILGGRPTGHLHGRLNLSNGTITGDNISYIYPDMETVLLGKFKDRIMKDAQETTVLGIKCDDNGLLYVSQYASIDTSSPHFYYDPPTNISYGAGPPAVSDPYETKWLELRNASNPTMGEGLFMRRNAKKGVFISSYHGFVFGRYNGEFELYKKNCGMNLTKSDDQRRHCSKYILPLNSREAILTITPEYDQPGSFLPSWGPKVNHYLAYTNVGIDAYIVHVCLQLGYVYISTFLCR